MSLCQMFNNLILIYHKVSRHRRNSDKAPWNSNTKLPSHDFDEMFELQNKMAKGEETKPREYHGGNLTCVTAIIISHLPFILQNVEWCYLMNMSQSSLIKISLHQPKPPNKFLHKLANHSFHYKYSIWDQWSTHVEQKSPSSCIKTVRV